MSTSITETSWYGTLCHCLITLAVSIVGLGFYAAAFFAGREHAQAEYRYIEANGGTRSDCPWYCGFLPSAWTVKGMLDWILPLAVATAWTIAVYLIFE